MTTKRFFAMLVAAFAMAIVADAKVFTFEEFRDSVISLKTQRESIKDFGACIVPLEKLVALYDAAEFPQDEHRIDKAVLNQMASFDYYDLACCYARIGKKKTAIAMLRKSVDLGWDNYGNLMWDINDNDLVTIAKDKQVKAIIEEVKVRQPLYKLKQSGPYCKENGDTIPAFRYQSMNEGNLKQVREYFRLDSVAGNGDELSRIKNILTYCHNTIRHDGSNYAFAENDAIDLYHYYKVTGRGINCRQLATVLMEMYLSMGFKARIVSCMPMDSNDYDSHVINCVWSETMRKWLYVDPTMNAWVTDENGVMLSIAEVRERLVDGRPMALNDEANHNNENKQNKEYYLETYMAKNLYIIACPMECKFNTESRYRNSLVDFIQLVPSGFDYYTHPRYTTSDPDIFWQDPE